jgi:hypothetical protein
LVIGCIFRKQSFLRQQNSGGGDRNILESHCMKNSLPQQIILEKPFARLKKSSKIFFH